MDREKVIKELEERIKVAEECVGNPMFTPDAIRTIVDLLKEKETANVYKCPNCGTWVSAENVVRCKDCKNLGYTNSHWFCKWLNRCVDDDWFCADGERKER